jgi:hypothetical protein
MESLIAFEVPLGPGHDMVPANRRTPSVVRLTYARADLATRHRHGISSLLAHRDDLRGVYAFADVVEESVRWSA